MVPRFKAWKLARLGTRQSSDVCSKITSGRNEAVLDALLRWLGREVLQSSRFRTEWNHLHHHHKLYLSVGVI